MVKKYVKKPVVIEAVQYDGFHTGELKDFVGNDFFEPVGGTPYIKTLEGDMSLSAKDYVIKGVKGEFYPCKPDIFRVRRREYSGFLRSVLSYAGIRRACTSCGERKLNLYFYIYRIFQNIQARFHSRLYTYIRFPY